MKKALDIQKIAEGNPRVDLEKVERAREAIKTLREQGVKEAEYNLAPPFSRNGPSEFGRREDRTLKRTSYAR